MLADRFLRGDRDIGHLGAPWSMAHPREHARHGRVLALERRVHGPVGVVAHPTGDTRCGSLTPARLAVPHALDPTGDDDPQTHHADSLLGGDSYDLGVPYDEDLADRIRELLSNEPALSERKMFGGLAFLFGGHMAVVASREGGIMVRVDPADADRLLAAPGTRRMEMGGRLLDGWLRVDANTVRTKRQLQRWVRLGLAQARSLPPKPETTRRR